MARRHMLRHPAHTIGANAVFVALVRTSRLVRLRGGRDALEEWRSAAACARMHCRPDGYGCYRRGESRFGFFVEYDRGTERGREYAAKLAAGPGVAIGHAKLAIQQGYGGPLDLGLAIEREAIGRVFVSDDAEEGIKAFQEKRKPEFKSR